MSLESMRRGFIGGSALALFIIKEFGLEGQAVPVMNAMRGYLEVEEEIISRLPPFLSFLLTPVTDYHDANVLYLEIIDMLALQQRPRSCQYYWQEGTP